MSLVDVFSGKYLMALKSVFIIVIELLYFADLFIEQLF